MNRIQWFRVSPLDRKSLKEIAGRLISSPYQKEARAGFNLESVRIESLSGTHIERVEYIEVVSDPLGGELAINHVRFDKTEFSLHSNLGLLECVNAGRNLKSLLNAIAKFTNFEVSITKAGIPVEDFVSKLSKEAKSITVNRMLAEEISLGDGVLGSIEVAAENDTQLALRHFVGSRKYALTRARVEMEILGEVAKMEISKGGTISSPNHLSKKIREALRRNVASLAQIE